MINKSKQDNTWQNFCYKNSRPRQDLNLEKSSVPRKYIFINIVKPCTQFYSPRIINRINKNKGRKMFDRRYEVWISLYREKNATLGLLICSFSKILWGDLNEIGPIVAKALQRTAGCSEAVVASTSRCLACDKY